MADKDSTLGQNAWMLPLGMAAPHLMEEATATTRGTLAHQRMRGSRAALRGLTGLLVFLGTYATMPTVSALAAYYANRIQ